MKSQFLRFRFGLMLIGLGLATACSSPQYQMNPYGARQTSKVLEHEYPVVWKGIKESLDEFRIEEANEEKGRVMTEWTYSTSTHKFIEFKINDKPRRKYLQSRYRFEILAKKQIVGVKVDVLLHEEVEKLNLDDGSFVDWVEVKDEDTDQHRAYRMLESIERSILAGRN